MTTELDPHRDHRSSEEERAYLLRRAEDHRLLAEKTSEPGARSIHQRLRRLYREQASLIVLVHPDHDSPQKDQERGSPRTVDAPGPAAPPRPGEDLS